MYVLSRARRITAITLTLFLSAGGFGLCAGWEATPEARMACCANEDACPMHKSATPGSASSRVVSQAQADNCCAASERGNSTPSSPTFVPLVSLALVVGPISLFVPPAVVPLDAWRAFVPLLSSQVRKHLLLSVFLI